jgi:hypothetical protein
MDEITSDEEQLRLTGEAVFHLESMRKWTMFLAIMGFIGSGFMILVGLFFAAVMRAFGQSHEFGSFVPVLMGIFYVILGAAYCIPSYFLLRFSTNTKSALASGDEESLTAAVRSLRTFFVFIGISVIAIIAIYILLIIGAIVFGVFAAIHGGTPSRV